MSNFYMFKDISVKKATKRYKMRFSNCLSNESLKDHT